MCWCSPTVESSGCFAAAQDKIVYVTQQNNSSQCSLTTTTCTDCTDNCVTVIVVFRSKHSVNTMNTNVSTADNNCSPKLYLCISMGNMHCWHYQQKLQHHQVNMDPPVSLKSCSQFLHVHHRHSTSIVWTAVSEA